MTIAWWQSRPNRAHALIAGVISAGLVVVMALSPDVASVHAASEFDALRAPGQVGFVAGHRGDQAGAPENTLPAFQLVIDSDVAFVETDVQLTSDGVPVLMHDWVVDRTTNGTGPVWSMTYQQISQLDAGSWYAPAFTGTIVPTLEQLLYLLQPSGKSAILELKGSWNATQTRIVTDLLWDYGMRDRALVASFDLMTLRALRDAAPGVPRVIISRVVVGDPAILAAECGAVAIATSLKFVRQDPRAVDRIREAGLGVLLYTLNDSTTWAEALALGVDGVITDRPDELDTWLASNRRKLGT